jgi:beta propeller repeat protein
MGEGGMKSECLSILLAFLFLLLISTMVSAGQESRITPNGESGFNPVIYNDTVVWTGGVYSGIIHMRDLSTGKEIQITNESGSPPAIYGDRIVWVSSDNIYLHNISSRTEIQITNESLINKGQKEFLGISGDRIVWEDNRDRNGSNGNWNIYVYNLSTSDETPITSAPVTTGSFSTTVSIYGDRIVWMGRNDRETWKNTDIYMYNFSNSTETRITTSGSAFSPKIYDDRIVYMDWRSGKSSIYLYNISTSIETQLAASESDHSISAFYGDRIVWEDYRNGNWDIYMYDLSTSTETQITSDKSDQLKPAVYGDRIVWQDYRNTGPSDHYNYCEIYMYDLSNKSILPFASFTTNITSGYGNVPLTVLFTDTSSGGTPTSWYWDFGDGTDSKHAQTATHTFTKQGTYNVSLTVSNAAGITMAKESNCITVTPPQAPVAEFFSPQVEYGYRESVSVNEAVSFMDNSTGSPTSWHWDFGDGNTSTQKNPAHAYGKIGGYTVNLTVKNANGSSTISKYGYVLIGIGDGAASPAYFSSDVTSGNAPLTVTFVDDKDAEFPNYPIWREWDFGDGVIQTYMVDNNDSATPYATHIYEKPGKYTVTLCLDNRGGLSIITKNNYITVIDPTVLATDFSANVTSGKAPLVVLFTDTSTGRVPTSWLWDFGDDINSKHAMNATHTFTDAGLYNITLTVTNETGSNTVSKSNYITVTA